MSAGRAMCLVSDLARSPGMVPALTVDINEVTAPFPGRIRGVVRLYPDALATYEADLDRSALHQWSPLAPSARVEVELQQPALRWSGRGYLDNNRGSAPLEDAFMGWTWSRATLNGGPAILYDVACRNGDAMSLAVRFDKTGLAETFFPPPMTDLPSTRWKLRRETRSTMQETKVLKTLEDGPFYARSLLSTHLLGEKVTAMHESLSLDRFRRGWVQMMLPFRMPRSMSRQGALQ